VSGAAITAQSRARVSLRHSRRLRMLVLPVLVVVVLIAAVTAMTIGAVGIPLRRIAVALDLIDGPQTEVARDWLVLWSIRLPRIALAILVGGLLAVCGAIMQGLFRNPLADPALVGVSSGAALTTAAMIVIGDRYFVTAGSSVPVEALPFAAFVGALISAVIL
jgi:iron complex transport system permease protein